MLNTCSRAYSYCSHGIFLLASVDPGGDKGARGKERMKRKIAENKIKREKVSEKKNRKICQIKQSRHSKG